MVVFSFHKILWNVAIFSLPPGRIFPAISHYYTQIFLQSVLFRHHVTMRLLWVFNIVWNILFLRNFFALKRISNPWLILLSSCSENNKSNLVIFAFVYHNSSPNCNLLFSKFSQLSLKVSNQPVLPPQHLREANKEAKMYRFLKIRRQ